MFDRSCALAACALLAAISTGCGPSAPALYPATGTVTFDGKPLDHATIMFTPQGGRPSLATTDASGKYSISTNGKPGAAAGLYDVTVVKSEGAGAAGSDAAPMPTASDQLSEEEMKKMQEQMMDMSKMMRNTTESKSLIPAKYSMPAGASGLNADVTSDAAKNVFDFDLKPE